MKCEAFLLTIGQIGLTLAGFIGLISVFRKADREWTPQESAGMKLMFEHSFAVLAFALLPFPLFYMDILEPVLWRTASFMMASFLAIEIFIQRHRMNSLIASGHFPRYPKLLRYHFFPFSLLVLGVQIINGCYWASVSAYAWGLIWLLNPPVFQFSHFFQAHKNSAQGKSAAN